MLAHAGKIWPELQKTKFFNLPHQHRNCKHKDPVLTKHPGAILGLLPRIAILRGDRPVVIRRLLITVKHYSTLRCRDKAGQCDFFGIIRIQGVMRQNDDPFAWKPHHRRNRHSLTVQLPSSRYQQVAAIPRRLPSIYCNRVLGSTHTIEALIDSCHRYIGDIPRSRTLFACNENSQSKERVRS